MSLLLSNSWITRLFFPNCINTYLPKWCNLGLFYLHFSGQSITLTSFIGNAFKSIWVNLAFEEWKCQTYAGGNPFGTAHFSSRVGTSSVSALNFCKILRCCVVPSSAAVVLHFSIGPTALSVGLGTSWFLGPVLSQALFGRQAGTHFIKTQDTESLSGHRPFSTPEHTLGKGLSPGPALFLQPSAVWSVWRTNWMTSII